MGEEIGGPMSERPSRAIGKSKVTTLRLDIETAEEIEFIARAAGQTVSATIRCALDEFIVSRKEDAQFRERIRAEMVRGQRLLERLAAHD